MMDTTWNSDPNELNYYADVKEREEEIRKQNQELDKKLNSVTEDNSSNIPSDDNPSLDLSPPFKHKKGHTIKPTNRGDKSRMKLNRTLSPLPSANTVSSSSESDDEFRTAILDVSQEEDYNIDNNESYDCDSTRSRSSKRLTCDTGSNAKLRIQQAQIDALTSKLGKSLSLKNETVKISVSLEAKVKQLDEDKKRLERELVRIKSTTGRKLDDSKLIKDELDGLRIENQSLKKEVAGLKSIMKESESKSRAREVRLNRAMESVDRFKKIVTDGRSETNESNSKTQKEMDNLLKQVTNLQKQKSDLLLAFKKQMKLIDILKRQKVHVEASRMLDFTEKEFMKVLDWGCKSKS